MGRIPKVEKERALQQQQAASSSSSSSSSSCQPADADSPSLSALPPAADMSSACLTCHRADVDVDVDRPSLSAVSDVTLNGCRPMAETTTTMTSADLNVTSAVNGRCQAQTMTNGCTTLHHGDDDAQHTRSSNRVSVQQPSLPVYTVAQKLRPVFTARHLYIVRTMPWQDVRLSVRPSVCHTPVLCVNGYTYP